MSQGRVVQAASVERSAHHERTTGLLLMSSLSARQVSACQAMRRPGPRPTVKPETSDREPGLTSDNAKRESRRNTRQKDATTSAGFGQEAQMGALARPQSDEGSNE